MRARVTSSSHTPLLISALTSAFSNNSPLQNLQRHKHQQQRTRENNHHITRHEQTTHSSHENPINLANLRELQCRRSTRQQETDDDEDGIVENADGDEFRCQGKHGSHDDYREDHAGEEGSVEEFPLFFLLLGGSGELVLREGGASEVGSQDDEDERDGDVSTLLDCAGDGVGDEGSLGEEEVLEVGDGGDDQSGQHGPERWVHLSPNALEEDGEVVANCGKDLLNRIWETTEEVAGECADGRAGTSTSADHGALDAV